MATVPAPVRKRREGMIHTVDACSGPGPGMLVGSGQDGGRCTLELKDIIGGIYRMAEVFADGLDVAYIPKKKDLVSSKIESPRDCRRLCPVRGWSHERGEDHHEWPRQHEMAPLALRLRSVVVEGKDKPWTM